jgi:hypothetical protein
MRTAAEPRSQRRIPHHGIDVNADAVRMRRTETGDLDAAIVGDLRVTSLPAGSYDVVSRHSCSST